MRTLHKHGWSLDRYREAVIKHRGVAGWEKLRQDMTNLSSSLF